MSCAGNLQALIKLRNVKWIKVAHRDLPAVCISQPSRLSGAHPAVHPIARPSSTHCHCWTRKASHRERSTHGGQPRAHSRASSANSQQTSIRTTQIGKPDQSIAVIGISQAVFIDWREFRAFVTAYGKKTFQVQHLNAFVYGEWALTVLNLAF